MKIYFSSISTSYVLVSKDSYVIQNYSPIEGINLHKLGAVSLFENKVMIVSDILAIRSRRLRMSYCDHNPSVVLRPSVHRPSTPLNDFFFETPGPIFSTWSFLSKGDWKYI